MSRHVHFTGAFFVLYKNVSCEIKYAQIRVRSRRGF